MKNIIKLSGLGFLILSCILHSCKKQEIPIVITSEITDITGTTAICGGTITDEGSGTVTERGVCWSTGITPTITDSKTTNGAGAGTFISNIENLDAVTTYYVRAYAKNSAGIGYGMAMSFKTLGTAPAAVTLQVTNLTANGATFNAVVNPNYLSTNVTFEYGTTTSYGQTVIATQSPVTGSINTNVSANVSGLTAGTIYHHRVKTINSLGTTYGDDIEFTTLGQAPSAITQKACCITATGATLNGLVNANYISTTVTFEYGLTTTYGSTILATQSPVTGNNSTSVSANISGLNSGTAYHFRIKAVNSLGTTYGDDMVFSTLLTDSDGNAYLIVTIGPQIWMKENLKTTKYANGENISSGIYIPGDDVNNIAIYGRLYTWYVVTDSRNICPTGWHVPSSSDWNTLLSNVTSPADLKESGTTHWFSPNTGATNSVLFTALPGGYYGGSGSVTTYPFGVMHLVSVACLR